MVLGTALLLNACGVVDSGSSSGGSGSSSGGSGSSGGGSGSSGGGSGGSGGGTTATYLVYTDDKGGLYLVDPANPTQPQRITDNPVKILREEHAVSRLNGNNYEGLHVRAIYYVDGDKGPLMRLSLLKGNSTPKSVQVSDLKDVCYVGKPEGLVGTRVMIVGTAGPDGRCNKQYIVKFDDMNSTFNSIDVTDKYVVTFVVGNDLKVKGAIIKDYSNILEFCDIDNLSNCSQLTKGVTAVYKIASNTQNEYLCVDGQIQIYNKPENKLSQTDADCRYGVSDDKYIYSVNNGNIEILDMNTNRWKPLYNSGDTNNSINIIGMTQNYLIASVTNNSTNKTQVLAIKKEDPSKVVTLISDGNVEPYYNFITPKRFYFTKNISGTYKACYWDDESATLFCDEDGTIWIGLSYDVKGTLDYSSNASYDLSLLNYPTYYSTVYRLLKVKESTGKLYAVDPSNFSSEIELGDISSDFSSMYGGGIGGNILLLGVGITPDKKLQSDVLFANLSTKNSLKRITNTPQNEKPSNIKNLF
jgi:hypothetical protein